VCEQVSANVYKGYKNVCKKYGNKKSLTESSVCWIITFYSV